MYRIIFCHLFLVQTCMAYFSYHYKVMRPAFNIRRNNKEGIKRGGKNPKNTTTKRTTITMPLNFEKSFFPPLSQYQVGAKSASEKTYPWIARVVHSRTDYGPHMCTAVCVEPRIFITSARCIYTLKVMYTTVAYNSQRLQVIAIVTPSAPTKQAFDDIGILVVDDQYKGKWSTISLFTNKRKDDKFEWFNEMNLSTEKPQHKVVGYAAEKGLSDVMAPTGLKYQLSELDVIVTRKGCMQVYGPPPHHRDFFVPCYYACDKGQMKTKNQKCSKYHGVDGGAVIETKTNKLFGIATWGSYFNLFELPVGFAVPNSDAFMGDLRCAKRIRDDKSKKFIPGHYQKICDSNK